MNEARNGSGFAENGDGVMLTNGQKFSACVCGIGFAVLFLVAIICGIVKFIRFVSAGA